MASRTGQRHEPQQDDEPEQSSAGSTPIFPRNMGRDWDVAADLRRPSLA